MEKIPVIDADTHVDETDETWAYIDDPEYKPVGANYPPGAGRRRHWLIDGYKRRRIDFVDYPTGTTPETRELRDVPARLRHMAACSFTGASYTTITWIGIIRRTTAPTWLNDRILRQRSGPRSDQRADNAALTATRRYTTSTAKA